MIGNIHALPWSASMRAALGLPLDIKDSLVFQLDKTVEDAKYPNKIGDQDRVAAGGQDFPGRANAFDGADQCAYVADNGALDVNQASTDFVLSGWVKGAVSGTADALFGKNVATDIDGRYGFYKTSANLISFFYNTTSGGSLSIATSIDWDTDTDWHLFTVRIDVSGSRIYVYTDGVLENAGGTAYTGTFPALANEFEFVIGASNNATGSGYDSYSDTQIRDVRVYHKDVTSAANLASLQKGEALGDEVAWWWCEGTDTLEVFDASGNEYHMTAANFDSTSFVEGNWQSLMNKYGYAIDVGSGIQNVSNCVNIDYTTFANGTSTGFDVTSNGGGIHRAKTASELNVVSARKYQVIFNESLNSGALPTFRILSSIGVGITVEGDQAAVSGSNSFIFTASGTDASSYLRFRNSSTATDYEVTDLSVQAYYDTAIPPDMSTTVNGVPTHDIFGNALTFCIHPESRVMTDRGYVEAQDVMWGDKIYQEDGEFHELRNIIVSERENESMVGIKAYGTPEIKITPEHKVLKISKKDIDLYRRRKKAFKVGDVRKEPVVDFEKSWVKACELQKGDYLILPKPKEYDRKKQFISPLGELSLRQLVYNASEEGERGCDIANRLGFEYGTKGYSTILRYSSYYNRGNLIKDDRVYDAIEVDEELAELFGWYIAEGSTDKKSGRIVMTLGYTEGDVAERLQYLLKKKFGLQSWLKNVPSAINVYCNSGDLARFLSKEFGRGAHNKRIPDFIKNSPDNVLIAFIKAYNEGDGCITKVSSYDKMSMGTVSNNLAGDIVMMMSKLGYVIGAKRQTHKKNPVINGKELNSSPWWGLDIQGKATSPFMEYTRSEKSADSENYLEDDNNFYIPVKKINREQYTGKLYDFTTDTGTIGMPFIVHNSGQAEYKAIARDSGALTGDGVAYITVTGLLTTDVITAKSTDVPTCTVNGRLDIADGDQCYGVTITRSSSIWAYLPMCEGNGNNVYDTSGNSHHGTGTNLDDSNRTVKDTPGDFDYLAEHGVTVVEYAGDTRLVPFKSDKTSQYNDVAPVLNASETYTDYPQGGKNLIPQTYLSMLENIKELYDADQEERYEQTSPSDYDDWTIAANISDWLSVGTNTLVEEEGLLKATIIDTITLGRRLLKEIQSLGADLVVGDEYDLIIRVKLEDADAGAVVRVWNDSSYTTSDELTTSFQTYTLSFIPSHASNCFVSFNALAIGNSVYIDTMQLFHKTTQTGNNLVDNGGARNAIGALITTDWDDSNSDGLADGWNINANGTPSIVTGNGFSGNAQRFELTLSTFAYISLADSLPLIANQDYIIRLKYRASNLFNIYASITADAIEVDVPANTGDAIEYTTTFNFASPGANFGKIGFYITDTIGYWLEIDEFEILAIIDGEFFEPDALGADPVIIQTDYFAENPSRYLTRYFNAQNWKDLILLAADNDLNYTDHIKLMKYTKNN